jgi:hypothetical protein
VPLAEVANLGAGHRAIEPAQAATQVRLADADGHQRLSLTKVDPCLEPLTNRQAANRQTAAIVEEQFCVVEASGITACKDQVSMEPAR